MSNKFKIFAIALILMMLPTVAHGDEPAVTFAPIDTGTAQATVQVFFDSRCDGFYVPGQDIPIVGANVWVGSETGVTRSNGYASIGPINLASATMTAGVELPATQWGFEVVPCYPGGNMVELESSDFGNGVVKFLLLRFRATLRRMQ